MTTTRCANCGCGIESGAAECSACGQVVVGASVGHMATRDFQMSPMPAPKYDLQFGVVESIAASFKLWTENLGRLFVLGLLPQLAMIPFVLIGVFALVGIDNDFGSNYERFLDEKLGLFIGAGVGAAGLMLVLYSVLIAAIMYLLNEKTQGVVVGPMSAIANGFRHAGWVLLSYVFVSTVGTIAAAALVGPAVYGIFEENPMALVGMLPGGLIFIGALWIGLRLLPMMPAIVVEDLNVVDAAARAWNLTRGRSLELFASFILFIIIYIALMFAITMLSIIPAMIPVVGQVVQIVVNALLMPLAFIFPFAIYAGLVRAQSLQTQA